MIGSARQIAVYAYGEPVDMRRSFNTLSALVVELGRDVLSGHYFLFVRRVGSISAVAKAWPRAKSG